MEAVGASRLQEETPRQGEASGSKDVGGAIFGESSQSVPFVGPDCCWLRLSFVEVRTIRCCFVTVHSSA